MPLKCSNHRNANAIGQCSKCGIAICEICNRSEIEDVLMCEACAMLSTFSTMRKRKKDIDEKREHKELEDSSKKIKRRTVIFTASVVMVSIIVIIEVIWYLSLTNVKINDFDPSENYFMTSMMINSAINRYMEEHDGKVPDNLENLIDGYLPESKMWNKAFKEFDYKKITPYKYELAPPLIDDDILDVVFSNEGPKIIGM